VIPFARSVPLFPLLLSTAVPLHAQTTVAGYGTTVRALPAGTATFAAWPNAVAWFDGTAVVVQENGQPPRPLLQFVAPRFGSFLVPLDGDRLLFAESSFDEVWLVPVAAGAQPQLLTHVHFAYDAASLGTGRAIVSAKTGGFGAGANDLVAIDLATGAVTPIGLVAGASGPVAIARNGDLLYATAPNTFPPPLGTVELLRWPAPQWAQALGGGPLLQRGNAQLLAAGLDSAGDLALDDDDDVLFVDYLNGRVAECSDLHAGPAAPSTLVDYALASVTPAALTFVAGGAAPALPPQFEPFAQPGAGTLLVLETDFVGVSQLRSIDARAATLASAPGGVVPAGPFAIQLQAGPAAGIALFALGTVRTGVLVPVQFAGIEQVVGWDAGLFFPELTSIQVLGSLGDAAWQLVNPGFAPGLQVSVQVLFANATATQIGATAAFTIQLGP
jgi:hypothetical protein